MHSPGVCGAILASGPQFGDSGTLPQSNVGPLIDALNAGTEMVLVAAAEAADALTPAVWSRGAYLVRLSPGAVEADALQALLKETLNRGRDAALVTTLEGPALTAETVRSMVDAYRAAGPEIWAVAPEPESRQTYPVLLGRRMIELFLRGREWRSVQEVLSANREHVFELNLSVDESGSPASP